MSADGVVKETVIAYQARAAAAEAQQMVRSHRELTDFQFSSVENKLEEIKNLVTDNFKIYDGKFWSLAIVLIVTLLGICGFLIAYTLFPGHR